jgi:hypothetical protein
VRPGHDAPRLVLLDLDGWESFAAWAPAVRRRGMRVARVSTARRGLRRLAWAVLDPLLYGPSAGRVSDQVVPRGLVQELLAEPTVDIVAGEETMADLREDPGLPVGGPLGRVPDLERQSLLYDKLALTEFARGLGVGVPGTWSTPPADVLPLLVKARLGAGGRDVRLVTEGSELAAAVADLDPGGEGRLLFQEMFTGAVLNASGVARDGRILVSALCRVRPRDEDPFGPHRGAMEVVDDPQVGRDLATLVAALEYTGPFCVDFVRSADGRLGLIDFNPRVFGGWLPLERAGVGILDAYLSIFGLAPEPTPRVLAPGTLLWDRLGPRPDVADWEQWAVEARYSVDVIRSTAAITGPVYAGLAVARATRTLLTQGIALARRPGRSDVRRSG